LNPERQAVRLERALRLLQRQVMDSGHLARFASHRSIFPQGLLSDLAAMYGTPQTGVIAT